MRSTTRECECKSRKPSSPSLDLRTPAAAAAVVLRQSSTAAAPGTCCDPRTRSCSAKQDAEDSANSQFSLSLSGEGEQRARDVDSRLGRAKKRCAGWQAQICGRSLARSAGLARSQTMEGFKLVRENVRQGSLLDVRRPLRSTKPLNPADITGSLFQMRKMGDLERVGIKFKKDVQRALCNAYHITKTQRQGRRGVWVETR
jgi:hypothetical protein